MSNWRPRDVVKLQSRPSLKNRIEKIKWKDIKLDRKTLRLQNKINKKNPENQSQALFFLNFEFLLFSGNSAFIEIF